MTDIYFANAERIKNVKAKKYIPVDRSLDSTFYKLSSFTNTKYISSFDFIYRVTAIPPKPTKKGLFLFIKILFLLNFFVISTLNIQLYILINLHKVKKIRLRR